jgi:hypothetical protein
MGGSFRFGSTSIQTLNAHNDNRPGNVFGAAGASATPSFFANFGQVFSFGPVGIRTNSGTSAKSAEKPISVQVAEFMKANSSCWVSDNPQWAGSNVLWGAAFTLLSDVRAMITTIAIALAYSLNDLME